jgi:hypothetical protein
MQIRWTWLTVVAALLTACAGVPASVAPSASPSAPATSTPLASEAAAPELVGEWVGIHDCQRIVDALREAGFDEAVVLENVLGNMLVPDASAPDDLADPADPCRDAVPREHSHFFTAAGAFGSRDFDGNQVDDGTFEIVDEDTVSISGTDFGFTINGDTLLLEPIVPDGCLTFECQWSIMVAMAGEPMTRSSPGY